MKKYLILFTVVLGLFYYLSKPEETTNPINHDQVVETIPTPIVNPTMSSKVPIHPKKNKAMTTLQARSQLAEAPDSETHPITPKKELIISNVLVDGEEVIAQGDVIVSNLEEITKLQKNQKPLLLKKPKQWKNGIIPFAIDPQLPETLQIEIKNAIKYVNQKTNCQWRPHVDEEDFVSFKLGEKNCYSNLGRIGGEQKISLSQICTKASITHEMLHTVGLLHEQSREDRDDYLEIYWDRIEENYHSQFKKIPNSFLNMTQFNFDFASIMLYPPTAFAQFAGDITISKINGEIYETNQGELSETDIKKLNTLCPEQ